MPNFLTAARLRAAIAALADTRGKAALLDFLIVKRTLAIKGAAQVAITQSEPAYKCRPQGVPVAGSASTAEGWRDGVGGAAGVAVLIRVARWGLRSV